MISAITYNREYGNYLLISHGDGYRTVYANIENIAVNEGDYVLQNTKIGEVGKSNNTSNDYVFKFLIFKDETTLNPRYWLK